MRTKLAILASNQIKVENDLKKLQVTLQQIIDELAYNKVTQCPVSKCQTCGVEFVTEEDFWDHYLVPDERFMNIGICPTRSEPLPEAPADKPWPFITCQCGHNYWAHWFTTTEACAHCNCDSLSEAE